MRTTVRTVVTILFVGIIVGIAFAVLYFGTSTGVISGGQDTALGGAAKATPYYAQVGWIRNTAPWPVKIESITTNAAHSTGDAVVYLERKQGSSTIAKGKTAPVWTEISPKPPYQLNGGGLRYLGFALMPQAGHIASFTSVTVNFSGPLGLSFHKTFPGVNVAARAADLPASTLAADPAVDSTSASTYESLLTSALTRKKPNYALLATVMGGDATSADAKKLLATQGGITKKYLLQATPTVDNPASVKLTFFAKAGGKGALPAINIVWAAYRWSVVR
jgi:hypothetical protein